MLQENLLTVKKYYPEIYNNLIASHYPYEKDFRVTLIDQKGHRNSKVEFNQTELYLHSSFDPYNEAANWLDKLNKDLNMYVIIGGGFYYHIDYITSRYPDKKILIIEPSLNIFFQAIKNIDITRFLENENILFYVSQDSMRIIMLLAQILINEGIQRFEFSCLPSYRELYGEFCTQVEHDIFNMIKTLRANIGTEYVHSKKWVINTFKNLRKTNIESLPLETIFNGFEGVPALIVAAGPSLEKQLELLRNNQNKFFIIAAGSAVNALEKNSITPHMVVAVDAEQVQDNIFNNIQNRNITLAYGHSFRFSSVDMFKGKKYWFRGNADSIVDFYEDYIGEKTDFIEIGPSCANEAMDIARRLGCNPLVFVGQDLAYTNQNLYTKGVIHELNMDSDIGDRINTTDMYGNEVVTKTSFLVMKNYFENYVKTHEDVQYFNCTEGGLEIKGMSHKKFKEIIDDLPTIYIDLFEKLERYYEDANKNRIKEKDYLKINNVFFQFVEEQVEVLSEKSQKRLNKVLELKNQLPDITLEKAQEMMDDIVEITNDIEETTLHSGVFHSICAAYFLSVRQDTYRKMGENLQARERFVLLLEGIEKQYLYYEVILQGLMEALKS